MLELNQLPARAVGIKHLRRDYSGCAIISQVPDVSVEERMTLRNCPQGPVRWLSR